MKHLTVFIFILLILSPVACTDMIDKSMFDKDYEDGTWNTSGWDRAKWK